jgi:ligand-binding sensor domain-containing protein
MLADSKGYIWVATDKGLFRFNGRSSVYIPFVNTTSKSVSYLQEDNDGVIWCMNFYNQLFYYQNDTLRRFEFDYKIIKNAFTFSNVSVGSKQIWFQSYDKIYELDKRTRRVLNIISYPPGTDLIVSSTLSNDTLFALSYLGQLFTGFGNKKEWGKVETSFKKGVKIFKNNGGIIGIAPGLDRTLPVEIRNKTVKEIKSPELSENTYIIQGLYMNNGDYWLCTQNGAYLWNIETGKTTCYLPDERVSDVVMDYQGNYWISTLDNGIYMCASLYNTLVKVFHDPLLDNFSRIESLPNGELLAGNSQGLLSKINLDTRAVFTYNTPRFTEVSFINYDTIDNVIICNRGVFRQNQKDPIDGMDYSKGIARDKFGNILMAVYNQAVVVNNHYGSLNRLPISCPLYKSQNIRGSVVIDGFHTCISLRPKRSIAVLASRSKDGFWVAYEDGLYQYHYDGDVNILTDKEDKPVVAKCMLQLPNGNLVVGTSTKGVMIFRQGKLVKIYNDKSGLSSLTITKLVEQDEYIWVLTDAGLDRIDRTTGVVTNYLEEYGLSNISINDFSIQEDKILFATPTGILLRYNVPSFSGFEIKFPLLKAASNGAAIAEKSALPNKGNDIVFNFEALHYLSASALSYQYRLKGLDTAWRTANNFANQITYNRLSPGNYVFEVKASAGANYKSKVRTFSFSVSRPFWQQAWFWLAIIICMLVLSWFSLRQWKKGLIRRQSKKEQLLKSQLVALRAQMNPHFLYNVLNTVQGLVYGNRKAEAGALLGNFSDLMRKMLQASDKQLLPLKDEVENLQLYLELEKARFDEGFSYRIEMNTNEDLSSVNIPSLLLQPFAENAVKHGLMHKRGIKQLSISFEKVPEGIKVTIDDNGIGRKQSLEINQRKKNKSSGFATVALNERMELFNRLYKKKITCVVTDKTTDGQEPGGTRVELVIPDYSLDTDAL